MMIGERATPAVPAEESTVPAEIRFENVSKFFGNPQLKGGALCAVDNLNLEITVGELVALVGKTGCGKSTMFNMIAGLSTPSHGRVLVKGHDPFKEFDWFRGKVAIVFQNDRLLPWRTAVRNVELGLETLGIEREQRRQTAMRWLSQLGLAGHEHDYPHALSGGMRQRVSIARAFATNAEILLCDEPFSALDEFKSKRLRTDFAALVRKSRKTTHSIDEAFEIGDRLVVLKRPAQIAHDLRIGDDFKKQKDRVRAMIHASLAQ